MSPRARRLLLAALVVPAVGAAATEGDLHAQALSTSLEVSGFPLALAPVGTDFVAGSVTSAPVSFLVTATAGPGNQSRTATVSIRCALPCPTTGTKPASSLSWRRSDLGTWTPIGSSDVMVEQRSMVRGGLNSTWSNTLVFRFLLGWTADPAGSASSYSLVMTLSVTAP